MQTPLRFPYVLFDLGSTLIYFDGTFDEVYGAALLAATRSLQSAGYALDEAAFPPAYRALIQAYYTKRSDDEFTEYTSAAVLEEALRAHGHAAPDPEHIRLALRAFYAHPQARFHAEEDAVPMLETLRARGHRLGIVSNASDDADVQTLVDNAELRPYFDFILTSAQAGYRKPSPRIFRQALAFWGAEPSQAVMIGDTISADIAGANALGIASVWIRRRVNTPENEALSKQVPAGAVIDTLAELPALLANWPR